MTSELLLISHNSPGSACPDIPELIDEPLFAPAGQQLPAEVLTVCPHSRSEGSDARLSGIREICKSTHLKNLLAGEEVPPLPDSSLDKVIQRLKGSEVDKGIADLTISYFPSFPHLNVHGSRYRRS